MKITERLLKLFYKKKTIVVIAYTVEDFIDYVYRRDSTSKKYTLSRIEGMDTYIYVTHPSHIRGMTNLSHLEVTPMAHNREDFEELVDKVREYILISKVGFK